MKTEPVSDEEAGEDYNAVLMHELGFHEPPGKHGTFSAGMMIGVASVQKVEKVDFKYLEKLNETEQP